MKALLLALTMAALALNAHAESDALLRVEFSNPGLTPSQWTLEFHPDGTGHFRSERGSAPADDPRQMEVAIIDRDVQVSSKFAARAFQIAQHHKFFRSDCESHLKVAFQGIKKIRYSGPDAQGGCEFNYSTNKQIQDLGESLVAVGSTLIEGARLELLYQHDPLGLDKAIRYVVEATGDGRMQQICAIRTILERLEDDPRVLDRVRKQARILLAGAGS
jgi:hypothetical protein